MPEEQKYAASEALSAEVDTTDTEHIDSDSTDGELSEAKKSPDAIKDNLSDDAVKEDSLIDASPLTSISEDGDQITLPIPTEENVQEDVAHEVTSPSPDSKGFVAELFREAPAYDEKKPRKIDGRFDFIELLVITLAAVFVITTFLFRHSIVDGNSMQNTLQDGEILIISGLFYTPERYDIVVLEDHSTGLHYPIVKRVIATEGETVKITSNGKIFVDGEEILDYFVFTDYGDKNKDGKDDYTYTPMEYTVPEGEIFVLGDHRNNSHDSRIFEGVDADSVQGKVLFRLYPFNRFGSVYADAEE